MKRQTQRMPRRYDGLVRFFRGVLDDTKASPKMKMMAAMRLSEVMLQHDQSQERKEVARERAAARVAEAQQEARQFLANLEKGKVTDGR